MNNSAYYTNISLAILGFPDQTGKQFNYFYFREGV